MDTPYDKDNVFAKILRKEIGCSAVLENDCGLAFHDINKKAPVHVLAIPKGEFTDFYDFHTRATQERVLKFYSFVNEVIKVLGLSVGGFKLITNCGKASGQEVFHYHIHILGGGEGNDA